MSAEDPGVASDAELRVVGVRVELPVNNPIVLLKEAAGDRYLAIWVGGVEASAIAHEQQGLRPSRPMTHDLLRDVIAALGASLDRVVITEIRDDLFHAELVFASGVRVGARSSDAIALALRCGSAIYGAESVLAEAGILIPDEQEEQVEKFREFLDNVTPEDFQS